MEIINEKGTRDRVINEALMLFKENGYDNITVKEICEKASISINTFYYHFKYKEEVLAIFYEGLYEYSTKDLIPLLTKDTYWEQIWEIHSIGIDQTIEVGYDILTQIIKINFNQDKNTFNKSKFFNSIVVPLIIKSQEKGEIKNLCNPTGILKTSQSIIMGIATQWCISKGSFDEKKEILRQFECLYHVREDLRKFV